MARKSAARGAVAALGFVLLFAGLVGGGVLYIVAQERPGQAVDGFARAPVGCTTTLEFSETGEFWVYEEVGSTATVVGCQPVADPTAPFGVEFTGEPSPDDIVADPTVSYDVDGFDGRSVQRIAVRQAGQYTVEVAGSDLTVVAAIGRDPADGVDDLRRNALIVAIGGVVLGLLLLVLSGRGSKKAAVATAPQGPGWGPAPRHDDSDVADTDRSAQVPVNPHAPGAPARAEMPSAPLSSLGQRGASWSAPTGEATDDLPPPPPGDDPVADDEAPPDPTLPDAPGRPSGT